MNAEVIDLQDYKIFIGGVWEAFNVFLAQKKYTKVAVIVDENTSEHCLPLFLKNVEIPAPVVIQIPAGESHKTLETCRHIWNEMMKNDLERGSLTVNLGGGVIGDMGGFCASTFKRGMDFVQFPTTLLSQVDASIGGKLGIDFNEIKNSIGVFKNPQGVFIEPRFLETLPPREIRSGFAEIVKHALIANAQNWQHLQTIQALEGMDWRPFLSRSLEVKKQIVAADLFEKNIRKALNFGHTVGHAVESRALASSNPLLHGEAIAIGMICESWLSHKVAGLPLASVKEIADFLFRFYDPVLLDETDFTTFIELMRKDKKNEQSNINFTFIHPIGSARINQTCTDLLIRESMLFYNKRAFERKSGLQPLP